MKLHQNSWRIRSSFLPSSRWHSDVPLLVYPKPLQLSASPTASAEHKPKDVTPFPPPLSPQPSQPCLRQTSSLQSSPQTFSREVLPPNPRFPTMPPGEELHKQRTKARWYFLAPSCTYVLSSHLCFCCFSSSSSYLWTAACLANDNIGVFPLLLTIVHNICAVYNIPPCTLVVYSKHLQPFTSHFSPKQCKGSGDDSTTSPS